SLTFLHRHATVTFYNKNKLLNKLFLLGSLDGGELHHWIELMAPADEIITHIDIETFDHSMLDNFTFHAR
ncbi:hypothetical protein, partial [Pseudomonas sp. MIACH]|uniref:hypothetical protein n=1 Tax=Pseudomonas sp. MIACH TaxID=1078355 RepID=UPI001C46F216